MNGEKCVIVVDERLPQGLTANTAAILGITIGSRRPDVVGKNVFDADGSKHLGIIEFPVPVLKAAPELLRALRERLHAEEFQSVCSVDFSNLAQGCKTYEEYLEKMSRTGEGELQYYGLAMIGPKKLVNRLTGSLPLLR